MPNLSISSVAVPAGTAKQRPITPTVGQIWLDTQDNEVKLFNGLAWIKVDPNSAAGMLWRDEQEYEKALCEKHPGLKELKEQLDEAKEKYEMYKALVQE